MTHTPRPSRLLTRLFVSIATPTAFAGYFCFARDWGRSWIDHVPPEFFRLDLNSMFPIALGAVAIVGLFALIFFASGTRTTRAEWFPLRDKAGFYRIIISAGLGTFIFGTGTISGASEGIYLSIGLASFLLTYAWLSLGTAAAHMRERLAAAGATNRLQHLPLIGRVVRPFRGRRKLVDAVLADPLARLSPSHVTIFAGLFFATGIAFAMGYQDSQTTSIDVIRVPEPEIVLRHYGDEIVTAPFNIATQHVTMRYVKRRVTTDGESIAIYHLYYTRPIQAYVPDEGLKKLVGGSRPTNQHPLPSRKRLAHVH
jgi:hypothetical protein